MTPSPWILVEYERRYIAEASALGITPYAMGRAEPDAVIVACPGCNNPVPTHRHMCGMDLITHRDAVCACGARLLILND